MRRLWKQLLVLAALASLAALVFTLTPEQSSYYTCEICGSVMQVNERRMLPVGGTTVWVRQRPGIDTCVHTLRRGAVLGVIGGPVADGQLVLVRRENACGGLIINRRLSHPDRAEYAWWYRTDGEGRLSGDGVQSGTGTCRFPDTIEFGPFELTWSFGPDGNVIGCGAAPGKTMLDRKLEICATDLTDVAGVDAESPQWVYRRCGD